MKAVKEYHRVMDAFKIQCNFNNIKHDYDLLVMAISHCIWRVWIILRLLKKPQTYHFAFSG